MRFQALFGIFRANSARHGPRGGHETPTGHGGETSGLRPRDSACQGVASHLAVGRSPAGIRGAGQTAGGPSLDRVGALALQPDGRILVAGSIHGDREGFAVVRYDTRGGLDSTFGRGGAAQDYYTIFGDDDADEPAPTTAEELVARFNKGRK